VVSYIDNQTIGLSEASNRALSNTHEIHRFNENQAKQFVSAWDVHRLLLYW